MNNFSTRIHAFMILALLLLGSAWSYAQTPGIPYQAYFTDKNSGYIPGGQVVDVPLSFTDLNLRFQILDDANNVLYTEDIAAKTDEFGLLSTVIGAGNGVVVGGDFASIVWDGTDKRLEIYIDFSNSGNSYEKHGEMELVYIPGPSLTKPKGLSSATGAPTASNPANAEAGDIYVDEATGTIYTHDGTDWTATGGGIKGAGDPGTNVQNPAPGDIYVDQVTGHVFTYNSANNAWENQSMVVSTTADNLIQHGNDGLAHLSNADIGLFHGTGAPAAQVSSPAAGDLYVNQDSGSLYVFDGSNWQLSNSQTLTSLSVVTNDNGTPADTSDDFDELIYQDEAGTQNVVELNSLFDVANGLTLSATGTVVLGGSLDQPTTITTSATNTLALDGLQEETAFDASVHQVLALDPADNVLKRTKLSSTSQQQVLLLAADGDTDFSTPAPITDINNIDVYRNGIRVSFTKLNDTTIRLEPEATCHAGDEIRIVQLN